jgi:membrane associated rhomboid family serine protease
MIRRIRLGAPLTLLLAAGCVAGTYVPGAAQFGIGGSLGSLLYPWTWLKLLTWPFVHADTAHLAGNMMFFLLLSPRLEKSQGWFEYTCCLVVTSLLIGIAHLAFGQGNTALIGASGWVFMMILLTTFTSGEAGTVAIPTLIVGVLYGWQEVRAALSPNHVSQFAHLLGGACGLIFGFFGSGQKAADTTATSPAKS